jgi:hypothetical protein
VDVGLEIVLDYLEHGHPFPSRRANADLDSNSSMGFDVLRRYAPSYVTSPRAIHRF